MNIVVVMPVIFNCTYCNKKAKLLILEDYRAKWEHFASLWKRGAYSTVYNIDLKAERWAH